MNSGNLVVPNNWSNPKWSAGCCQNLFLSFWYCWKIKFHLLIVQKWQTLLLCKSSWKARKSMKSCKKYLGNLAFGPWKRKRGFLSALLCGKPGDVACFGDWSLGKADQKKKGQTCEEGQATCTEEPTTAVHANVRFVLEWGVKETFPNPFLSRNSFRTQTCLHGQLWQCSASLTKDIFLREWLVKDARAVNFETYLSLN